jgi:hypothetical protein
MKRQQNLFSRHRFGNRRGARLRTRFRAALRLIARAECVEFVLRFPQTIIFRTSVSHDVHRFEQLIAGRPYMIEVAAVTKDRWRACIVRLPGVPTALMPFYGRTPDEAAQHLSAWLTRAYERAAAGSPRGSSV